MNDVEIRRLATLVCDRMFAVYRAEYVARCVANEPDSLLALVVKLKAALTEGPH